MIRRLAPKPIKNLVRRVRELDRLEKLERLDQLDLLAAAMDQIQQALGRIETRQLEGSHTSLERHEFRVYSHAGEDGIIQFLIDSVAVPSRTFVEFGVEDYREANTRFLLMSNHWKGLVLDGDPESIRRLQAEPLCSITGLAAHSAFVTRENVNDVLADAGMTGELGILSIDVDGNDYWIFDAVDIVKPAIAIVEYNHRFGPSRSVTIPYDPTFVRRRWDSSWLYSGASLKALVGAASRKGMSFVGCNSFGNNAFFVRSDLIPAWMPTFSAEDGYVAGRFKESIVRDGVERVLTDSEEDALLESVALVEVT